MKTQTALNRLVKLSTAKKLNNQQNSLNYIFEQGLTFEEMMKRADLGKRQAKGVANEAQLRRAVKEAHKIELEKFIKAETQRIETILNAGDLTTATINVEWRKSRTWGANPHATLTARSTQYFDNTTGTASGCGYDKESAAMAQALNASNVILKALYLAKAKKPNTPNRRLFGYGSGYSALPSFEGGVGSNCYASIFSAAGYNFTKSGWGKMFDSYTINKK